MTHAVTAGVPRLSLVDRFRLAEFDAIECELANRTRSENEDVLLARSYLRMQRPEDAIAIAHASPRKEAAIHFSLASAYARRGEFALSVDALNTGAALAHTKDERDEERYMRARIEWLRGESDTADQLLGYPDFGSFNARAEELRGWAAVRRGGYLKAVKHFEYAARMAVDDDADLEVACLRSAASIAREIYVPSVMNRIEARLPEIRWTSHMQVQKFHLYRSAGWFSAIGGNLPKALQRFRIAGACCVSPAWQMMLACDRALLSHAFGEHANAVEWCSNALELARSIAWEDQTADERGGLFDLIALLADSNVVDAKRFMRVYDTLPAAQIAVWENDTRVKAFESYARGMIERAEGRAQARATIGRAHQYFKDAGYEWRAALCLVMLGAEHRESVCETLDRMPNSWLLRMIGDQYPRARVASPHLTSMERQILTEVIKCKTDAEIAAMLERSVFTVRDHVNDLKRKYGVKRRTELVRVAMD